jgi:ssDNA-binding Zn-finger/Zn-ribbon topoisomerase 1
MNDLNSMAETVTYVQCKICKEDKQRYKAGKFPNGKDFRYHDQNARQWSGLTCPDCHNNRNARRLRKKRKIRKLYV